MAAGAGVTPAKSTALSAGGARRGALALAAARYGERLDVVAVAVRLGPASVARRISSWSVTGVLSHSAMCLSQPR